MKLAEWLDYKTKYEEALQLLDKQQALLSSAASQLAASRAQVERMMNQHDTAIARLSQERDALQAQLALCNKDAIAQAERLARALAERDAALQPKPSRATRGVIRGPYQNGAKPPLVE